MRVADLIPLLETEYPNDVMLLKSMNEEERNAYIAKLELINHIKLLEKDD